MEGKELKVISSKKPKKKKWFERLPHKIQNILKSLGVALLLLVVTFCVAALKIVSDESTSTTDSPSSIRTTESSGSSIIDEILPTTSATNNDDIYAEIEKIFTQNNDSNFVEVDSSKYQYTFNKYMKQLNYSYYDGINTKIYTYENKTIIYYNDASGIVKLFIFNSNTSDIVESIKTISHVTNNYSQEFVVIDGEIYYIEADTYRDNGCLVINSPLVINKYDLTTLKTNEYKTYENSLEFQLNCGA